VIFHSDGILSEVGRGVNDGEKYLCYCSLNILILLTFSMQVELDPSVMPKIPGAKVAILQAKWYR